MQNYCTMPSPFGNLYIAEENSAITHILVLQAPKDGWNKTETPILSEAKQQLQEYFDGERKDFSLPLAPLGTPFQAKVWQALESIPYGTTCTYGDIAQQVGSPKAFRAVGGANHNNPISIVIPCHRVIGSDKSLTGYAGGLPMKIALLDLEQKGKALV